MEQLGKILQNYRRGTATLSRHQTPDLPAIRPPVEEMAGQLHINPEHTFGALKNVPGIQDCIAAVRGVLAGPSFMALVYGGVGNGKTHLLEAAVIELYNAGKFCRLLSYSLMLLTLKSAINNPDRFYDEILTNYLNVHHLVIDDIGAAGTSTDFANDILENIVCYRYDRELFTLMTTNRDISSLPERVQSRLKDKSKCYLVLNKAEDYRPKLEAK